MTSAYRSGTLATGRPYRHYRVLDSSNAEAARLLSAGTVTPPLWLLADEQSAGRGRQARRWVTGPGNLAASLLLPMGEPVAHWPDLAFIAAVAVRQAIAPFAPQPASPQLKWPNDVLIDGAKVAGILIESVAPDTAIVGIGVNIAHAPDWPDYPTACLTGPGGDAPAPLMVLNRIDRVFAERLAQWRRSGTAPILAAWQAAGPEMGAALCVRTPTAVYAGCYAGLDDDGALLIDCDGSRKVIRAGDVALLSNGGGHAAGY